MSEEDLKILREEQNKKMLQSVILARHKELKDNLTDIKRVKDRVILHQNSRSSAIVIRLMEDSELRLINEFSEFISSNPHATEEYRNLCFSEEITPISPIRV